MKKILLLLSLVVWCNTDFAQSPEKSSISLGVGYGVDFGGFGGKVSIKPMANFALVGGLGNYFGPPLSYGSIDNYGKLTNENLSGVGYSIGIEYCYNGPAIGGGLHYIATGPYNGEKSLQGLNWCMFGGDVYFNNVPLFIHYGVNVAFFPYKKEVGGIFGVSLGIGYSFDLSRSEKKVQTKHLRNL
jgi:hypothetical protein